jgi:hypothetical protein
MVKRPDQEFRKTTILEGVIDSLPDHEDHDYRIQVHPVGDERQRVAGRAVQPVRVLDYEQQRSRLRGFNQKI